MEGFIFNVIDFIEGLFIPKKWHHPIDFVVFWSALIAGFVVLYIFGPTLLAQPFVQNAIWFLAVTMPLWLPLLLARVFFIYYIRYIRADWIKKEKSVLLEIKIPKETNKSPLAMEIFFTALYQTGSATLVEAFWKGKVRPWFSFELVSQGGEVHLFIWALRKWRNLIEAQLYAQYPTIEIHEVADYTDSVRHDPVNLPLWATYFVKDKSYYPLKTYVDYGLDKLDIKEEFKIDPMTSVLEYLGSMRKGEQVWIQIIIQAHRAEKLIDARFFGLKSSWTKKIDKEIEDIRESSVPIKKDKEGNEIAGFPHPTPGQVDTMKALQRSRDKLPYDATIRGFYISTKEAFNPIGITGLIGSFRQYNSMNSASFKLGWYTDPDLPWRDYKRKRRNHMEKEMLEAYKLRSFFQYPFKNFESNSYILTTEELATIFHLPGGVSQTPTLERITSKKAEPPPNLPK